MALSYFGVHLAVAVPFLFISPSILAASECPPLTDSEVGRVLEFVTKELHVPSGASLSLVRGERIAGSCNERIRVVSRQGGYYLDYPAVLLPDHVLLAPVVFDTSVDPFETLRRQGRANDADLTRGSPMVRGPKDAPISVVVFADFQCPYCAALAPTLEGIVKNGSDVRVTFRHFPLPGHVWAFDAARSAACAAEQSSDVFWDMHDYLFKHQSEVTIKNLAERVGSVAQASGKTDMVRYEACLSSPRSREIVQHDIDLGLTLEIQGTPTVFVNGQAVPIPAAADVLSAIESAKQDR